MYLFPFLVAVCILLFIGGLFAAPWVPTKKNDFERIAEMAKLKPGMVFYDVGSGSGNMLFYLSQKYNIHCIGIEISPLLYLYSKIRSLFYKKVKIVYGDFYQHDISKADALYVFLMPKTFYKLKIKIAKEIKEDSKIIVSCWPLPNCNPIKISKKNNEVDYYLYNKTALLLE